MSKRDPRRYEFIAAVGPPTTDVLSFSLDRKEAAFLLCCIADELAKQDETVSSLLVGWLEDKGPR